MTGGVRFDRVDQLRGLAALAVVICHSSVSAYQTAPNLDGGPWPWLGFTLGFGYLGVPLFFVISGFCIHLPHARALASGAPAPAPAWRRFFARRFWRLYPPYLAAMGFALVLLSLVSARPPVSWVTLAAQALLVHTFHPTSFDGINPPAWTLAVEAQLYLAYPVVFWLMARRGALRALAVVLGVTLVYRLGVTVVPLADFGGLAWEFFLARWFEWVLGAVIAEWAVGRLALPRVVFRPETAVLALGLGVLFEWQTWRYGLYTLKDPLYGIAFALLLCVALHRERAGRPSAVGRSLAALGLFSYSLYLLHRPIQLAVEPLARDVATWPLVLAYGIPSSLLIMSATMPIVLGASWLFYRYCEAPCVVRAQRAGRGEGNSLWPRSPTGTVRT